MFTIGRALFRRAVIGSVPFLLCLLSCSNNSHDQDSSSGLTKQVSYEIVRQWVLPNKNGVGRVVLISKDSLKASMLEQLGQTLSMQSRSERMFFAYVFTDREAATTLRDNLMDLSAVKYKFFCTNNVATYVKNANTGINEYTYSLVGMCADDPNSGRNWKKMRF